MNQGTENLGTVMDHEAEESAAARASQGTQESSDEETTPATRGRTARLLGSPEALRRSPSAWTPPTCPKGITAGPTEVSIDQLNRAVNRTWTDQQGRIWWKHIDESHRYTIGSITFVYHQPMKTPVGEPKVLVGQDGHTYQILKYKGSDDYGFPEDKVPNRNRYPFTSLRWVLSNRKFTL